MSDLVSRLRGHAYRLIEARVSMQNGYGVAVSKEQQDDLERSLDEAADEIERLRRGGNVEGG